MVHVTHHRGEARALGDRAVLIDRGRIVRVGDVRDVIDDEDVPSMRRKKGRA
jgi:ABC-type Fe3+/spermidine/putrescine transport system ATPase subunit